MLYYVCRPLNTWRGILLGSMGALFIVDILMIPGWVRAAPLDDRSSLLLAPMMLLTGPVDYALHSILEKLDSRIKQIRDHLLRKRECGD